MCTTTGLSSSLSQIQNYQGRGLYLKGGKKSQDQVSWNSIFLHFPAVSLPLPAPLRMRVHALMSFHLEG